MKAAVTTDLTKQQFQKLMKRPSMSELDGDLARENRRNENALQRETTHVDRQVKINLSQHRKNSQEFIKVQSEKLVGPSRRSSDSSFMSRRTSGSFQKLSVLDPQSQRGSVAFSHRGLPGTPFYNGEEMPSPRRRRHSETNGAKINKTLEIRQKLYREFNMPDKSKRHRPWSPTYCLSVVERAHQNIQRRLSEPITKPSDRLSDEIKEKLAYITGEKPRHSIAVVPLSPPPEPQTDEPLLIDGEPVTGAATEPVQPTPPPNKPAPTQARPRQRRQSEVLRKPQPPSYHRRLSETINRVNAGSMLPPLEEST